MGTRNDGVPESQSAKELFNFMSRYMQAREKLTKQTTPIKLNKYTI